MCILPSSNPIRFCPWSGIITYICCQVYHQAWQPGRYNLDLKYIKNQSWVSRCNPDTPHRCLHYVNELELRYQNTFWCRQIITHALFWRLKLKTVFGFRLGLYIVKPTPSCSYMRFPTAWQSDAHFPGTAYIHYKDGSHLIRDYHAQNVMKQGRFDKIESYFNIVDTICKPPSGQPG